MAYNGKSLVLCCTTTTTAGKSNMQMDSFANPVVGDASSNALYQEGMESRIVIYCFWVEPHTSRSYYLPEVYMFFALLISIRKVSEMRMKLCPSV